MGKRKKIDDRVVTPPPLPPDSMPCTSGGESSSRKKFSHSADFKGCKPFPPSSGVMDSSWDRVIARSSPAQYRHNLGRSILLKRSRNRHGHHYWRNSGVHLNPSSSYGKFTPWEENLSFKLDNRHDSGHPQFTVVDSDRSFAGPERISSSSFLLDADSLDTAKLQCRICNKWLRRKPYLLGSSSHSSGENSVVAVLVCGHIYHADCLEQETPTENKSDPPCPVCLGSLNASVEVRL